MRIRNLWAFQAVMETGSVTEAAKRIHRTQPQVSRLIAALAEDLGFELFHRQGRGLVPTHECLRFYESTRHILAGFDEVARIAESIRSHHDALLRIVAQPYFAYGVLAPAIAQFSEFYPSVRVSLEVRSRVDVGSWVSGQRFDLGFAALPLDFPGVQSYPFAQVKLVIAVPEHHVLAEKAVILPEDILHEPFIALRPFTLLRKYIDDLCLAEDLTLNVCAETSSGLSACQMVKAGMGITLADPVLASSVEGVICKEFSPALFMPYGFLLPTAFAPSEVARKFATLLVAAVQKASPDYVELIEGGLWES